MSFSENIQNLRKAYGISQEQFASQLNVSRQAVSKWESGNGYPEMEKLLMICDLYQCSLDSLVKGEIEFVEAESETLENKAEYERITHRYALLEAIGLDFIFISVILLLSANDVSILFHISEDLAFGIGIALLLVFVAIAIGIFNYAGSLMNDFKQRYPQLNEFYDEDEIHQSQKMYNIFASISIILILFGVAIFMLLSILFENLTFPINILLFFTMIAIHLLLYYGSLKDRTNIEKYNKKKKF